MWWLLIGLFEFKYDRLNTNLIIWTEKLAILTVRAPKNRKKILKKFKFHPYPISFPMVWDYSTHISSYFHSLLNSSKLVCNSIYFLKFVVHKINSEMVVLTRKENADVADVDVVEGWML
jgi:hypothetical protein